jgi:hypothetical protein
MKKAFNPVVQVKGSLFIVMVVQVAVVVYLIQVAAAAPRDALRRNRRIACRTTRQTILCSLFSFS